MSSLTNEWQIKTKENDIKYVIGIKNFDKKIKTFRSGREIHSKIFKICSSAFKVIIYPGGDEENEDYVSVFLHNMNPWRVRAIYEFSLQDKYFSVNQGEKYFANYGGYGEPQFIPHSSCTRDDLLSEDGVLSLQVDVELLEEEVVAENQEDTADKLKS
eukprot:GFUD01122169.1.p1 GENE.GFUD01122169.1~~GFUD01122169.1.p1  ORF type:complete len:158 (-),score=37.62 GFUD01122169.1:5-478(-)